MVRWPGLAPTIHLKLEPQPSSRARTGAPGEAGCVARRALGGRLLLTLVPGSRRSPSARHRSGPDSEGRRHRRAPPVCVPLVGAPSATTAERVVRKRLPLAVPPRSPSRCGGGMAPASLERCAAWPTLLPPCARQPRWWPVGRSSTRRPSGRACHQSEHFGVSIGYATPPQRPCTGRPRAPARGTVEALVRSASSNCARTRVLHRGRLLQIRGQALVPRQTGERSSRRSPMRSATSRLGHSARAAFLSRMSRKAPRRCDAAVRFAASIRSSRSRCDLARGQEGRRRGHRSRASLERVKAPLVDQAGDKIAASRI